MTFTTSQTIIPAMMAYSTAPKGELASGQRRGRQSGRGRWVAGFSGPDTGAVMIWSSSRSRLPWPCRGESWAGRGRRAPRSHVVEDVVYGELAERLVRHIAITGSE